MDVESVLQSIRDLSEERDWLHHKAGFLLATLSLDRNRESLRRGDDWERLFAIIDREYAEFSKRFPGVLRTPEKIAATFPERPDGKYLNRRPNCWPVAMEVMGGFVHSKHFAPRYRPHATEVDGEWFGPLPDDSPEWNEAIRDCMGRLPRRWEPVAVSPIP